MNRVTTVFKALAFVLILSAGCFSQSITSITTNYVEHASVMINWQTSGAAWQFARFRYGPTPYDCKSGTGGTLQGMGRTQHNGSTYQDSLGGLTASTQYSVCPELSNDGNNWVPASMSVIFTTAALPNRRPALPK